MCITLQTRISVNVSNFFRLFFHQLEGHINRPNISNPSHLKLIHKNNVIQWMCVYAFRIKCKTHCQYHMCDILVQMAFVCWESRHVLISGKIELSVSLWALEQFFFSRLFSCLCFHFEIYQYHFTIKVILHLNCLLISVQLNKCIRNDAG